MMQSLKPKHIKNRCTSNHANTLIGMPRHPNMQRICMLQFYLAAVKLEEYQLQVEFHLLSSTAAHNKCGMMHCSTSECQM